MSNRCDLHIHSHYSDGTCSPAELVRLAEAQGLSAIALCDHNTIDGLPEFCAAGESGKVQAVPGIEFSVDYAGTELHILGLFIQPEQYGRVKDLLEIYQRKKEDSNLALAKALNAAGYAVDYEAIQSKTSGIPNRAHFAADLVEKGYFGSIRECFQTILSPKIGLYVPPPRPDAFEAISFIKEIGSVAVLAHPFLSLQEPALRVFLKEAVSHGLDGMETMYSTFDKTQTRRAQEITHEFGLLQSGGSDFHGANKPDISIGTGRGDLVVPLSLLHGLEDKL